MSGLPDRLAPTWSAGPLQVDLVAELLDGHWYDAAVSVLDRMLAARGPDPALQRAHGLAMAARRALDLDAEDFAAVAAGFATDWAPRLADSAFPVEPRDEHRGALGSLTSLYELMLEVTDLRAVRREPLQVVVVAHLIGEYLPQLAWQTTLDHGGDPLQLAPQVRDSRWGSEDEACPHGPSLRSTARRAIHACQGDVDGYTAYLDRFHSRQGHALAVCAMNHPTVGPGERPDVGASCPNPCAFATTGTLAQRRSLDARVRLALMYLESPLVALRHHAPAGHFFGVPSVREISAAWLDTWERLSRPWPDGSNPLIAPDRPDPAATEEALPGLSTVVSVVAGFPIRAGRVIRDIAADLRTALDRAPGSAVGATTAVSVHG